VTHLTSALAELAPEYTLVAAQAQEMAQSQLEAEQQLEAWRAQWETVQNEASRASQSAEVEKTKISGLERQVHQAEPRQQRLQSEYQTLTAEAKAISWQHLDTELQYLTQTLAEKDRVITQQQQAKKDTLAQRDNIRQQLMHQQATVQEQQTQLASLQAVQDAALGKQSTENNAWLTRNGLAEHQRLAEVIIVDKPWQLAVETVLGDTLEAIILTAQDTPLATLPDALMTLDNGNLSFFEPCEAADLTEKLPGLNQLNVLLDYVSFKSESAIPGLGLHQIYAVDTLAQAMSLRFELDAMGSMITQSGIWLGRNWLRVKKGKAEDHSGILERDQTIKALTQSLASNSAELESLQGHYQQIEATIEDLVIQLESAQAEKNQLTQQLSELTAQLGAKKDRLHRLEQRQDQIQQELHELNDQCQTWQAEINASRQQLDQALEKMNATNQSRQDLTTAKAAIVQQLEQTRAQATSYQQTEHNLALKRQKMQSEQDSTTENMYRLERQQQVLTDRLALTMQDIQDNELPIADLEKQWAQLLEQRLDLEGSLTTAKEALSEIESSIHVLNQQCLDLARQLEQQREQLQKHKMEWQALSIHRQNIEAQFNEPNSDFAALVQALPQEATEQKWSNRLKQLAQQIQSLGAINLAAIEEYQSQLQRKQYLDTQDQDLQQALSILETAINKIDQETRARFKETFNSINQNFKGLFPRLFGGGEAKLVLTGDELLDAGINVIAKPPGKKNSSIHLLSGGEKALTAVALVFAIFELNPAPFCILDEVDAPLDDSNVRRFCHLVKSMSQNVQFIYISHNKLAMEMAEQLQGVTMKEPGVSRIVTVDMEQATTMAQA
jgi:chromosome segregation protein